jgi:hypothetical protein
MIAKGHFYENKLTLQQYVRSCDQLQVTLFSNFVTQFGLLLQGSVSNFQSFLPSELAISSRAFSKYTIESNQLSAEKSSKLHTYIIKYIYTK